MYSRILLSVSIVLLSFASASGQRSIGKVTKQQSRSDQDTIDIPINQWIGKRFIFVEKSKRLQQYGYDLRLNKNFDSFSPTFDPELEVKTTHNLRYSRFVGKTITAIAVEEAPHFRSTVTFEEYGTNLRLYASAFHGTVDGIVLVDDLARAKSRWLGKTIYSNKRSISTYDSESDEHGSVDTKIGSPLKVVDVWWGLDYNPIWLVVETTKGEKGYVPTRFSWTNMTTGGWESERPWEYDFYEFNLRQKYPWTKDMWRLIDMQEVRIGMTQDQVILSLGRPKRINEDVYQSGVHEQWIYESRYLYFKNGKLTAIQNR